MRNFLHRIGSYLVALLRLLFLNINFIFSGLHIILFNSTEITNIELKGAPLRCDRKDTSETMAYLDKLCLENPDLLDYSDELDAIDGFGPIDDFKDFPGDDQNPK